MRLALITLFTLLAFAANSLLCRMALGGAYIDPMSFTTLRLVSGAAVLWPLARWGREKPSRAEQSGSWSGGLALFWYAAAFSMAYVTLNTGTGALLLFGAVQLTMMAGGLLSGERPHPLQWVGLLAALAGLIYLVAPGLTAPDPLGAALMLTSGAAWGIYSLKGRGVRAPIALTAANFRRTIPLTLLASLLTLQGMQLQPAGLALALTSGSITSGLGYVLWYQALRGLTTTRAAIVQLLVPVLAAFGGVVVLSEHITLRLVIASLLILGGVGLAVSRKARLARTAPTAR